MMTRLEALSRFDREDLKMFRDCEATLENQEICRLVNGEEIANRFADVVKNTLGVMDYIIGKNFKGEDFEAARAALRKGRW
jgi:hypothetical protein